MSKKQGQNDEKQLSVLILADNQRNVQKQLNLLQCPFESPLELLLLLLEWQGFKQIFLYSCKQRVAIGDYVAQRNERKFKKVQLITSEDCCTFSSIIRDVYAKKIIKDDFILIDSHIVTEIDFTVLIQQFYKQKESNKGYLLMNVFQQSLSDSVSNYLVSYYKDSKILLFYEELDHYEPQIKDNDRVRFCGFNKETAKDLPEFSANLMPTGIAIFSKSVLSVIFSLNEFQMNLQQFIKEIITSQISSEQIGMHVISQQIYHQKIQDSSSFLKACTDQLKGSLGFLKFPINNYYQNQFNTFIAKKSKVSINTKIDTNSLIKEGCIIEEGCVINNCIISDDCYIPKGCVLENVYLNKGIKLAQNCRLKNVLIVDQYKAIEKVHLDNVFILANNCIPWRPNKFERQSFDEGDCEISSSENSLFEEEEFDQKVTSQLLQRILDQPSKISEICQEMQGLWLGCGSDPTFWLNNLMDSLLEIYEIKKRNFMEFLNSLVLLSKVLERHIDWVSEESPTRDIIMQKVYEFCLWTSDAKIHLIFQQLFKCEILQRKDIIKFQEQLEENSSEKSQQFKELLGPFVNWLQQENSGESSSKEETQEESVTNTDQESSKDSEMSQTMSEIENQSERKYQPLDSEGDKEEETDYQIQSDSSFESM